MRSLRFTLVLALPSLAVMSTFASELRGVFTFNGLPVPGASFTSACTGKTFGTVTDAEGVYLFSDLADGSCGLTIEMFGFAAIHRQIVVAPGAPASHWELSSLPLSEIEKHVYTLSPEPNLATQPSPPPNSPQTPNASAQQAPDADLAFRSAPGLLVNGSVSNAADSNSTVPAAFGNNRFGGNSLYNGSFGIICENSALDAAPYSLWATRHPSRATVDSPASQRSADRCRSRTCFATAPSYSPPISGRVATTPLPSLR